jgi:deoxyribonuclease-4
MNPRGLKMWGETADARHISEAKTLIDYGVFDYIEVTPTADASVDLFDIGVPVIIHATSERWGTNLGDRSKREFTMRMTQMSFEWADILRSKYVIMHPGYGEMNSTLEFLDMIYDKRILVENMPMISIKGDKMLGYSVEDMKTLTGKRFGFCMDIGHAIKAAMSLKKNPHWFAGTMRLVMEPKMYHLSDGSNDSIYDDHLSLGDGGFDLKFIKEMISRDPECPITFETPRLPDSLREDVRNAIRYLSISR